MQPVILELFQPLFLAAIVFFLICFIVVWLRRKPQTSSYSYQQRDGLFTEAEASFFHKLEQDVAGEYRIFAKVRIADILTPQSGLSKSHWQRSFNQIGMKHFDFVLCDPRTLEVKAVLELDDSSHDTPKARRRDALVNEACASAGLKLVRIGVGAANKGKDIGDFIL